MTKRQLFERGKVHVHHWCAVNGVEQPEVVESDAPVQFGTCAYYRHGTITISVQQCAAEGHVGRMWSYPGYVVDRTPYGVLCHELGHHVDNANGLTGGTASKEMFAALCPNLPQEPGFFAKGIAEVRDVEPITNYSENVLEWFAELFRLFVTNPDLLREMRPVAFAMMIERWPKRAEERHWSRVLNMAPRQLKAAENKIRHAKRGVRKTTAEQGMLTDLT